MKNDSKKKSPQPVSSIKANHKISVGVGATKMGGAIPQYPPIVKAASKPSKVKT